VGVVAQEAEYMIEIRHRGSSAVLDRSQGYAGELRIVIDHSAGGGRLHGDHGERMAH
jgi:hypothetical protein